MPGGRIVDRKAGVSHVHGKRRGFALYRISLWNWFQGKPRALKFVLASTEFMTMLPQLRYN